MKTALLKSLAQAQTLSVLALAKVFCPTGPGGGVDPTCKPGGGTGGSSGGMSLKEAQKRAKDPWQPSDFDFKSYNAGVQRTGEEQDSINKWSYVKTAEKINDKLTNGTDHGSEIDTHIKNMDSVMKRSSLPGDVVAYRGIAAQKDYEVGEKIHSKGFSSTTLDKSFAKRHAQNVVSGAQTGAGKTDAKGGSAQVLKILLPKGSRVTTGAQSALELIVDRNSTYRVLKKTKTEIFAVLEQED